MGNYFGSQIETNPVDVRNKEIIEARERYLKEQFERNEEKAENDDDSTDSAREPGYLLSYFHDYCLTCNTCSVPLEQGKTVSFGRKNSAKRC